MLQSVYLRTKPETIAWGNAIAPIDLMTGVDPNEPLFLSQFSTPQIYNYDIRDKELSYRDLVLGGILMMIGYKASDVWGMPLRRYFLPAYVSNVLYDIDLDRDAANLATPAHVSQVNSLSIPYRAFFVDKGMYSRDVVMLEAMARICKIFSATDRPLAQVEPTITVDNLWSLAGEQDRYSDIGINIKLDRDAYGTPDRYLAKRDNDLATLIAEVNRQLLNIFEISERVYLQVDGSGSREPEVYCLISEDTEKRVFAAEPFLPSRLRLVYYKNGHLQWATEDYRDVQPPQDVNWGIPELTSLSVSEFLGVLPDQTLSIVPEMPERYDADKGYGLDSQWYRQKAARINFEATKWGQCQYGVVYSSALTNFMRSVQLSLTQNLGAGLHRVSVKIRPVGTAVDNDIQLFVVLDGVQSNAVLSLAPDRPDVVSFDIDLPAAVVITDPLLPYLTVSLGTDMTNISSIQVEAWDIRAQRTASTTVNAVAFSGWHSEIQDRTIEGIKNSYTDNLKLSTIIPEYRTMAGVEAATFIPYPVRINNPQAKKFTSDTNSTIVRITASSGYSVGDVLVFVPSDSLPLIRTITYVWQENETYYMPGFVTVTIDSVLSVSQPFSGSCWIKDTAVFTATGLPSGISINSSTGIISGIFNPAGAGDYTSIISVAGALSSSTNILWHVHPLLTPTVANNLWVTNSTESWMTAITTLYESRLRTSHRIGRPYDIGRASLVPEGLGLTSEDEVECSNNALRGIPVYRAFQPWMLDAGIYVMEDDFEGRSSRLSFDYLFDSDGAFLLQSPDLTWWQVSAVAITGEMQAISTTYGGDTLEEDLIIGSSVTFGFSDTNGVWRVTVSAIGEVTTTRYLPCDAVELINYTMAFAYGYGPVFRLRGTSTDGRLKVSNIGELEIEEL